MNKINMNNTLQITKNQHITLTNDKNETLKININKNKTLHINIYSDIEQDTNIIINLNENSTVFLNMSTITTKQKKHTITINHKKHSKSYIKNHGLTKKDGKLDITINGIVKKGNTGVVLIQDTKIITNGCISIIRPNLYIEEYDTISEHKSRIGTFREEELFYLYTRGLDQKQAYELLEKGYLFGHINEEVNHE